MTTQATRREFIKTGIAIAAVSAIPSAVVLPSAEPALPAWTVGDLGEMNNRVVFAKDELAARAEWFLEEHGKPIGTLCQGRDLCTVDDCACYDAVPEARRSPVFDHPKMFPPSEAELLAAGWTICCDRCGYETTAENNAFAVNEVNKAGREIEVVVCQSCATPAEIKAEDIDNYEHLLRNEWIDEADIGDAERLQSADALE